MKNIAFLPLRRAPMLAGVIAAGALLGCEAKTGPAQVPATAEIQALANKTKAQLVTVKGGHFQMGDFGEIHSPEKLAYTRERHDGPQHKVTLSNFAIMKYKVTLGEYDLYAAANNLPLAYSTPAEVVFNMTVRARPKSTSFPVGVDWQDAQNYCRWIGKQVGQAMDLPTEAQWEYAARVRGTNLVFATDDGNEDPGRNFPTFVQIEKINGDGVGPIPVGLYPPNQLGLYDMGSNGYEWTNDWYGEDYYARSPEKDPRGPESGLKKVLRGLANDGNDHPAMTFQRSSRATQLANSPKHASNGSFGFRCVSQ